MEIIASNFSVGDGGGSRKSDVSFGDNNGVRGPGKPGLGDVYYDLFVPSTMNPQGLFKNLCVPVIMEFAGQNVGNKKGWNRDVIAIGLIEDGVVDDPFGKGVPSRYIAAVVNTYFQTDEFINFETSISKGQPVLSFFMTGEQVGHAVLVVGYNVLNNTYIYMDPGIGELQYGALKSFFMNEYNFPLIENN